MYLNIWKDQQLLKAINSYLVFSCDNKFIFILDFEKLFIPNISK